MLWAVLSSAVELTTSSCPEFLYGAVHARLEVIQRTLTDNSVKLFVSWA